MAQDIEVSWEARVVKGGEGGVPEYGRHDTRTFGNKDAAITWANEGPVRNQTIDIFEVTKVRTIRVHPDGGVDRYEE